MTPLLPQLSKGFGRRKLIELLPILFVSNPFFTSLSPFSFFFAVPSNQKLHLVGYCIGVPFYYFVPKFTAYGFKRFNNKSIFQSQKKIDLVEIMSLNVMDEAVLRSPEWVSSGGPPVARSSCSPGPRSGRSYFT